ncbi:DNA internalization-related competence protein ComEC/Rec2 [candidate division KSB1 bacterium]
MQRKPALYSALAFSSGILIQNFVNIDLYYFLVITIAFVAARIFIKSSIISAVVIISFGALDSSYISKIFVPLPVKNLNMILEGVITQKTAYPGSNKYVLQTTTENMNGVNLIFYTKNKYDYGDYIEIRGKVKEFDKIRIPYGFDKKTFYKRQGIAGYLKNPEVINIKNKNRGSWFNQKIFYPVRIKINDFLNKNFSSEHASILSGLLIGEREKIDPEIFEDFKKTGAAHILAISGLHVGFIYFFLLVFAQVFRIRPNYNYIFIAVGLVFYAFLTGLKPSVFRAVLFALILIGAKIFQRREDGLNTLGAAAFLILIFRPYDLFSASFQLSFTAVFGIIILSEFFNIKSLLAQKRSLIKKNLKKYFLLPACISIFVTAAVSPLQAFYFYQIPLTGILLNIFIIPLTGLIVALGLLNIITGVLIGFTIPQFVISLSFLTDILTGSADLISRFDITVIPVARSSLIYLVLLLTGITAALLSLRQKKSKYISIIFFVTLISAIFISVFKDINRKLEIVFFDVGQGDSAFISVPGGTNILIDTGDRYYPNYIDFHNFFKAKGIRNIDYLILSHRHSDHIGQAAYIIKNMRIENLISLPLGKQYRTSAEIDSIAFVKHVITRSVRTGETLGKGTNWRMYILNPDSLDFPKIRNENNRSIVLKFVYDNISVLFPGDIESEYEEKLASAFGSFLDCDILKFPHHGSITSINKNFLNFVKPEYSIFSAGIENRFGFPADSSVNTVKSIGSKIYRTDFSGSIIFESDGKKIILKTMN